MKKRRTARGAIPLDSSEHPLPRAPEDSDVPPVPVPAAPAPGRPKSGPKHAQREPPVVPEYSARAPGQQSALLSPACGIDATEEYSQDEKLLNECACSSGVRSACACARPPTAPVQVHQAAPDAQHGGHQLQDAAAGERHDGQGPHRRGRAARGHQELRRLLPLGRLQRHRREGLRLRQPVSLRVHGQDALRARLAARLRLQGVRARARAQRQRQRQRPAPEQTAYRCRYLLPAQREAFLAGKGLPSQRQKCLVCTRYVTNYVYILARTDPNFKVDAGVALQTFANATAATEPLPHEEVMQHACSVPTHVNCVSCADGYRPEAMIFVDEDFMQNRAQRDTRLSVMAFRPVVRFSSSHYRYVQDDAGENRIIQVGIGQDRNLEGLGFRQPPPRSGTQGAAKTKAR